MLNQTLQQFSSDLLVQGYTVAHIQGLRNSVPQFQQRFKDLMADIDQVSERLSKTPDAYHLLSDLEERFKQFLEFTSAHRAAWIFNETPLAATA